MENNELKHYGVLGMRWGVRRTPAQLGRSSDSSKKRKVRESRKAKKAAKAKASESSKKTVKDMTDAELREKINRLNLEKQYKDLSKNETAQSRGKQFVKDVLKKSAENLAPQVLNYFGAKGINKLIGEKEVVKNELTGEFEEVLKEVVFANNKKK